MRTRKEALAEGKKAKALLSNPRGWRVEVWKNFGWHVVLRKGGMSLHWSKDMDGKLTGFWTLFSASGGSGGEMFWTPHAKRFRTPDNAVRYQLRLARSFVKQCQSAIDKAA